MKHKAFYFVATVANSGSRHVKLTVSGPEELNRALALSNAAAKLAGYGLDATHLQNVSADQFHAAQIQLAASVPPRCAPVTENPVMPV